MKKSVRIRKAKPGETPGYKNKTKQFLQKANLGMNVTDPNSAQSVLNKIYDIAYTDLKLDTPDDVVFLDLTNRYGVDEQTALMIMQAVIAKLTEEGYRNDDALNPPANPEEETQQQQVNQDQMSAEDQEQEELAMSDFGYYDQGDDDRSYIDQYAMSGMEEDQQGQSFGGYYQDGGMTEEQQVLNQYGTPGNLPAQKPFSIEDLMAITPGIQNNPVFPDINSYIGDYGSTGWSNQNWLAKKGGSVPKLPKARLGFNLPAPIKTGYNWVNKIQPMQNLSGINRALVAPLTTGLGYGMTKLPWIGSKFQPQLNTSFTQNAYELPKVLMGEEPAAGIFTRRSEGWDDGSFLVDRLELAKEDIAAIINEATDGRSSFELSELNNYQGSQATSLYGSIGGVYPANARINTGMDDAGNTFFEISHKFKPGERTAHGFVPTGAKETTFRNRFYYGTNDTGELQVFDNAGKPLIENEFTAFQVKRPFIPSFSKTVGDSYIRDFKNPVFDQQQLDSSSAFNTMFNRTDLTGLPPTAFKDLGLGGKLYRGLEQYATGAWMPSMFGYNPIRTRAKNINQANIPTYQYTNPASQATYPLGESNYAQDINNATNYHPRLGRKGILGLALGTYVGYNAWDAFMNPCQCIDPTAPNYMELDGFGKCPCGTDVGESRVLDPSAVEVVPTAPVEEIDADTMQFLIDQGIEPTDYNYYLNQNNPYVPYEIGEDPDPGNKKKGGNVSKKKFVKRLVSIFEEGGSNEVGKGDRQDTATKDIEKMKSGFLENLKTNSNKAISAELYDKAKNHPQIMEKLMANGYKENLAEEAPIEAKWGMNINTGGYVDMGAENPLTKFISGGMETNYYEPYDIPMAQEGIQISDKAGNTKMVTEEEAEMWYEALNDNPDLSFTDLGFASDSPYMQQNQGSQGQCPPGSYWNAQYNMCVPRASVSYNPVKGPTTSGGLFRTLFPANVFNQRVYPGRNPYVTNILGNPVATDVYKSNWRGKPKKWLDIYQVPGTGNFNMTDLNAFREGLDTRGSGRGGKKDIRRAAKDMFTDAKDMFRNVQDEVQDYGESRKDNRYQKYLGDQYGEDYWYGDRGDDPYKYEADFYTQGNEAVPGTKSQKQLDKLYAKEDRGRLREARQDQRQYNRDMRQADREQAQRIRKYRRKQDFEFGGMMPMARKGFTMEDDFGADQQNQGYSNPFAPKSEQIFNNPMFQGTPFQGMSMTGTGQYANNQTVEQIQEDAEKQGQQTNEFVAVDNKSWKPVDTEAMLQSGNAIGTGILGAIQRGQMNKTNRNQLMDTTDVFNNYANKTSKDRGDWTDFGSMAGMFRYDQEGQDRSSRATYGQYGGYMEQGGTHKMFNGLNMRNSDHKHYEEDEVVYMTPEEIEQYLAAGGQIEYL